MESPTEDRLVDGKRSMVRSNGGAYMFISIYVTQVITTVCPRLQNRVTATVYLVQRTRHASGRSSDMRLSGGFSMRYTKPCLTFERQCELLRSRGLGVEDEALAAVSALTRISYYRLSAHFAPFRTDDKFNETPALKRYEALSPRPHASHVPLGGIF
jgi:hypothetical protein